ncbi:MAG: DEAD/DEAH box helicase, partial [Candidatus Aenigmarchaeota archaeon]|nr:DEAD/DEAH box helicase [Candidatus Aenigmarchaeota archaeon]
MDRPSITDDELAGLPGIYAAGMERRGAVRAPYSGCGFIGDPLEAELEAEVGFVFADETDENLVEEKNWLRKEYEERDRMPEPDENLAKMVAAGDRNGLIAYFMCDVEEMAARYSKDGGPEYMDLLCEGALALTEYVMGQSILRRASLAAGATAAIRRGISRAALAENTERFVVEYDSQKAEEAADCADVDPVGEFDRSDELALMGKDMADALDALPNKRQLGVIMMRLGLGKYETHHTNMQIMERLGYSTPQGVLHAYNSGLRKLKSNSGKKLAMYLDAIGPNRAKGTERASAEEQTSMTELIRRARDDIEASSGKTTREFMKFYNLNMLEFADYLSALYPRMTRRSALQIVRLSEQEKMALKRRGFREYQKFGSLEAMRNTLRVLEKRKADAATAVGEQEMLEKLRDIYSPMFFSDKKKCFEILDREAASDRNPERLRVVFRRLRKYFDEATGMSVRGISTELDDFQKVDIDILSRHNSHIIASEMGTGKSLEAIAYAMKKGMRRILVVSTKSGAYSTWPNELKRHLTHTPSTAVLDGQMFTDRELLDEARNARWFVTTYATAARYIDQLRRMGFDMVVLDESHKVNNASTDQSAALTSLNVPHKLAISGSLFKNRRSELFPVLNWLWPDDFPDQREFEKLYCIKDEGLYLLQYELRRRMILRHKDDVLDIPDVKHITETATLGDSEREYMQMEDNFLEWLKAHESDIRRSHPDAA